MAYPTSLDSLTNPTATDQLSNPSHSTQHINANDAIEAIEAELGTLPKGSAASVKARLDALPRGVLGYAQVVANQAGITSETDLTGLSVAVTVGTSRRIQISTEGDVNSSVTDDDAWLLIKEGTTYFRKIKHLVRATQVSIGGSVSFTPSSGAHTYKIALSRASGTGNLTMLAESGNPAFILVEDIGPA